MTKSTIDILEKVKNEEAQIKIHNRWDIFKALIIEPEVTLENLRIDMMAANITAHFENVLKTTSCEPTKRGVPNFGSGKRSRRSIFKGLRRIFRKSGKFVGWTVALTAAGTIGSNTAVWLDHHLARQEYMSTQQNELSCNSFNYGCIHNVCWANCGNREDSADWCFTNANATMKNSKHCKYDSDCDPCEDCVSECFMEY